jgi:predicted transposase/invertase (TIGR01784 family)
VKTDTIFYRLFQAFPSIFFELIGEPATQASNYQFTSIELKQQAFRLDGLFLPSANIPEQPIYFVEIQFQKDQALYYRLFAEIFLYLYQYQPNRQWRAVAVYAKRSLEPDKQEPHLPLLNSSQVQRVYLDELEEAANTSVSVGTVQLVVEDEETTAQKARQLISQTRQQITDPLTQQQILEFIETIVIYKFPRLSRQEVEAMLGLDLIRNTRVYQEAFEEGEQQGRREGEQQGRREGEQQGRREGKLETIPRLLNMGLSVEQIAEALDLDIEIVRQTISPQP